MRKKDSRLSNKPQLTAPLFSALAAPLHKKIQSIWLNLAKILRFGVERSCFSSLQLVVLTPVWRVSKLQRIPLLFRVSAEILGEFHYGVEPVASKALKSQFKSIMIVSRIDGGLGNQLFQYAYGFYLARKHRCTLWLDTRLFEAQPTHGYLLDQFRIEAAAAGPEILDCLPGRYRWRNKAERRVGGWKRLQSLFSQGKLRRHKETPFGFQPRHLNVSDMRYLVGYWQSEQFFPGMRDELLAQFSLRNPLSQESENVLAQIQTSNSLAVHVRKGDYVTNPAAFKIYYQLGPDYYRWAINDWAQRQTAVDRELEIFVFSNDFSWCREHLTFPWKTKFVDHNQAQTAHEDLVLMSAAQCCVISNSTFSWWAAWLNQRKEHVVYAPHNWFQPGTLDGNNIVPLGWRRPS